jgi:hypothetical protein
MVVGTFQEKSDKEKEEIEEEEKRFEGSGYDRDLIELLGKCRVKKCRVKTGFGRVWQRVLCFS